MSNTAALREKVRQRAKYAYEFCSVSESNAGSQLTLDHFQPKSRGIDSLDNLLYCCIRCNQYQQNYWPNKVDDPKTWNPLVDLASAHFLERAVGRFFPITDTGRFTIERLRLNRPPLVSYRSSRRQQIDVARLLEQYKNLVQLQSPGQSTINCPVCRATEIIEGITPFKSFFVASAKYSVEMG